MNTEKLIQVALTHEAAGRQAQADVIWKAILRKDPQNAKALAALNRGVQQEEEAEAWLDRATAALNAGEFDEALEAAEQAAALNPDIVMAWRLLVALRLDQRHDRVGGIAALQKLVDLEPDDVALRIDLGRYLRLEKRCDEACVVLEKAVPLAPDDYDAWIQYASALRMAKQSDKALAAYEKALCIQPDSVDALKNLAVLAMDRQAYEEALQYLDQALAIDPDHFLIIQQKVISLLMIDQHEAAFEVLDAAFRRGDTSIENRFWYWLAMPSIFASREEIASWRARYFKGMETILATPDLLDDKKGIFTFGFRLAYQDEDNRLCMERMSRLLRSKIPNIEYTSPHLETWRFPVSRRVRIGFCSQFLCGHTIGNLYRGFLRELDRKAFEVVIIHSPSAVQDSFSNELDGFCDSVVRLEGEPPDWQGQIAALQLDVLFYPDIGMSPETGLLAFARLAPVQLVSYGHPDTTGIDTLDYFVGCDLMEPQGAEVQYTERLIRLSRLPFFYQLRALPDSLPTRAELGLPETGTLYGCLQSLFKLHPDFDPILARIAEEDTEGHLIMLSGEPATTTARLRARWAKTAPVLNARVHFVERTSWHRFMALQARCDVMLDPIHFGAGNTFYESITYGKPFVTWPGRFARGRVIFGAYQQMGLATIAPIAQSLYEYADVALAFGRDARRREAFEEAAATAAHRHLYADTRAVRELEIFLMAALEAASRGEKLPSGWKVPAELSVADTGK